MAIDILLLEMIKRISYAVILGSSFQGSNFSTVSWSTNYRGSTASPLRSLFSSIAILGTYGGIPIQDALANSRMIGIMAAGLIWRPVPRHVRRYRVRLAPLFVGWFYGPLPVPFPPSPKGSWPVIFSKILQRQAHSVADCPRYRVLRREFLQMLIILLVAQPYDQAYALVNSIAVPMTIANSLGLALFMYIIKAGLYQRTQQKANQSQNILSIARETVRYFRKGLNPDSANAVVQIIKKHSPTTRCLLRIRSRFSPISGPKAITMRPA